VVDGTNDITIDATMGDLADWEAFVPTYVRLNTAKTKEPFIMVDLVYMVHVGGFYNNIPTTFYYEPTVTGSGITWVDVEVDTSYYTTNDVNQWLTYGLSTNSGTRNTMHTLYQGSVDYFSYLDVPVKFSTSLNLAPWPDFTYTYLRLYRGTVGKAGDIQTDLYMSNDKYYFNGVDNFCSLITVSGGVPYDVDLGKGRVHYYHSDIYSNDQDITYISSETFSSVSGIKYLNTDLELGLGKVTYSKVDTYSSLQYNKPGPDYDIRTWSLLIDNFSLDVGEYVPDSSTIYVDLVDYLKGIDTVNSTFWLDGSDVPVTFSGIAGGYRMFYNPPNNFTTSGTITVTAHAVNNVGDIYNINYYLLHGYDVKYTNTEPYDATTNILVRMQASNTADCYNTEADAYSFVTKDLPGYNLHSSIRCVVYEDLGAEIYPQSTAFFYDKTYTITMKGVRDLNGNTLEDFVLTFTIENP